MSAQHNQRVSHSLHTVVCDHESSALLCKCKPLKQRNTRHSAAEPLALLLTWSSRLNHTKATGVPTSAENPTSLAVRLKSKSKPLAAPPAPAAPALLAPPPLLLLALPRGEVTFACVFSRPWVNCATMSPRKVPTMPVASFVATGRVVSTLQYASHIRHHGLLDSHMELEGALWGCKCGSVAEQGHTTVSTQLVR
jgi:hypothetical protein